MSRDSADLGPQMLKYLGIPALATFVGTCASRVVYQGYLSVFFVDPALFPFDPISFAFLGYKSVVVLYHAALVYLTLAQAPSVTASAETTRWTIATDLLLIWWGRLAFAANIVLAFIYRDVLAWAVITGTICGALLICARRASAIDRRIMAWAVAFLLLLLHAYYNGISVAREQIANRALRKVELKLANGKTESAFLLTRNADAYVLLTHVPKGADDSAFVVRALHTSRVDWIQYEIR